MDNISKIKIEEISTEFLNDIKINEIKKYSDIKFILTKEECSSCNIDSFTIIKDNNEAFQNFINTESLYIKKLYLFLNKIKNLN